MKKLLMICCAIFVFAAAGHAQDAGKPVLSKEKKAELKKMKEEHLATSFKEADVTDEQARQVKQAMEDAQEKSNQLKADNSLKDEEKEAKKKEINEEKNQKIKDILGDKFKAWNEIRKKQKAEEEAFSRGSR